MTSLEIIRSMPVERAGAIARIIQFAREEDWSGMDAALDDMTKQELGQALVFLRVLAAEKAGATE